MGIVCKVRDPEIGRVVVKNIHLPEGSTAEPQKLVLSWKQEAQTAGRLPPKKNIVLIYEYGEAPGIPYIAMAYVGGRDLKSFF